MDALATRSRRPAATPGAGVLRSLRGAGPEVYELLGGTDALIVTVLAAGGTVAGDASAGGDDDAWDVAALAALDVPVLQGLCLTSSRAAWAASDAALSPMDAAMQVAVPEFDGRLITVPFSFKEAGPDGVPVYVADPERAARVAGHRAGARPAAAHARPRSGGWRSCCRRTRPSTPGSATRSGWTPRPRPWCCCGRCGRPAMTPVTAFPEDGDTLIHALIAAGGHDVEWLTEEQLAAAPMRVPAGAIPRHGSRRCRRPCARRCAGTGATPPGELYVDGGEIVLAGLRFGNVVLMIQPPRGFGENPIAIYHDPDLPPSHHYLAAYRWLDREFGAHAVVHLGKHGTWSGCPARDSACPRRAPRTPCSATCR